MGSADIVQMPGLEGRNAIDARLSVAGMSSGSLAVNIFDVSAFGDSGRYEVNARIDCLEFDGPSVWFGAATTQATYPFVAAGDRVIGLIEDRPEGDRAFSGPAQFYVAPGATCHDRPALPVTTVRRGDFTVR